MRRIALVIAAAVLVALVLAAALVDWRFWYRWYTLPEDPGEWPASYYQPTVTAPGDPGPFFRIAAASERSIDGAALDAAAAWADEHNSAALLVLHKGVVQLERYWRDIGPDTLFTGRAMTRSLIPPLVASALEEGAIRSLNDRIGDYLPEWRNDPRGQITVRQLLENTSGLENDLLAGDPDPFNKNTQLSLSGDFYAAALDFELSHTPGEFFALANVNAQLLGMVLEAATGEAYESYLDSRLWAPLGNGPAELYMDRPGGIPAVYCCFRATPRDWLRVGYALLMDGQIGDTALWPAGWVEEMTRGSAVYPNYGYQIWVGSPPPGEPRRYRQDLDDGAPHGPPIAADGVFFLEGGGYRTMYVLPEQDLVILRLGYFHPGWKTSALPNLLLAGLKSLPEDPAD